MGSAQTDILLQLVGVAPAGSLEGFRHEGVEEGFEALVVAAGGFDAVVSEAPTALFEGEDADKRLQDVAWLTPRAQRHERLVDATRARAVVMPVGFGSMFSSVATLDAALRRDAAEIEAFFEETGEADEWSIKVWADRAGALAWGRERLTERNAGAHTGSGAAYLLARKQRDEAADLVEEHALELCDELVDSLEDVALDAVERRPMDPEPEGERWLLAHVALLVHPDDAPAFDSRLDALATPFEAAGMTLELSGPWAPYSFCPRLGESDE